MSYHHENLQEALIKATLELINQHNDHHSVSLRKVARQLGVSHAAPYRHFADKEALLAAVAEEGFRKLTNCLNQSLESTSNYPLQQIQATGVAYIQFAVRHPSHYRVMFSAFQFESLTFPSLKAAGEETFMVLANIIQRGQEAGAIKSGHPRQLTQVAWSLVHGLATLIIDRQILIEESEIVSLSTLATQLLIQGLSQSSS